MTRLTAPWLTDHAAQSVCAMLEDAGYQAWFVGGCVRNALLGAKVSDLDIATDARPEVVLALAGAAGHRAVPTGIDHGTVTVIAEHQPFEITTFRRDVETDGRRAVVSFADSMAEDARRRDFTMNALYASRIGEIADPIGGMPDLEARRVRFIGTAKHRIREDYLRILRFFRFHAWYGDPEQGLDADGLAACAESLDGLTGLSRERIGHELRKLLGAPDPATAVAAMQICGALARVLPGAEAGLLAPLVHAEQELGLGPDWQLRLVALGGPDPSDLLRLSKAEARRCETLRLGLTSDDDASALGYRLGKDDAIAVLALRFAMTGTPADPAECERAAQGAAQVFPLRAEDLMPRFQGPELGARLAALESAWIESGFALDKAALLDMA